MITYLDIKRLKALIRSKRGTRGMRETSAEIGNVSTSTLSRVENGKIPDMQTFIALCNWLEVRPGDLFVTDDEQQQLDTYEEIIILLLGDKDLPSDTAYALAHIIKAIYCCSLE